MLYYYILRFLLSNWKKNNPKTKIVPVEDWQLVVDKYELMTTAKQDSLGTTMVLRDLCDLYWMRIDIKDKSNKFIGYCYKDKDGEYYCSEEMNLDYFTNLLDQNVKVKDYESYDEDNYPIVEVIIT